MPVVWCSISGHGFGHAAQIVPVLNELARQVRNCRVVLRTTVPAFYFKDRLQASWELSAVQQDIGCMQNGPLSIDVTRTWEEHERFHESWDNRVSREIEALRAARARLVLSNISYLGLEAGAKAGLPSIALASLSWDQILRHLPPPHPKQAPTILERIRESYGAGTTLLRLTPGLKMDAFRRMIDIGPVTESAKGDREGLRRYLKVTPEERVVLVAFGGIPLSGLPSEVIDKLSGFRFIVDGTAPGGLDRVHGTHSIPYSFKELLPSVDLVLTKPSYGMVVEAVSLRVPVVYVQRHTFVEEGALIDYLHTYGRAAELSVQDFMAGRWSTALNAALEAHRPALQPLPVTGAGEAVAFLKQYL